MNETATDWKSVSENCLQSNLALELISHLSHLSRFNRLQIDWSRLISDFFTQLPINCINLYRLKENFNMLFLNFPHNCVALPLNFAKNRLTQTLANYWFSICQHLFSGNNFFLLNFQQIFSITWLKVRNFPAAFYNFLRFQSQSFALFFSLSFCLIFQFIHISSLAFFQQFSFKQCCVFE